MPVAARHTPWVLGGYFTGVALLGALLAPLAWWAGMWLLTLDWVQANEFLRDNLVRSEFDRYFRRAVLLAALILFWPAWRLLAVRRAELGLPRRRGGWRELLLGFGLAAVILLAVGAIELQAGAYVWREGGGLRWDELPEALIAGFAVAVLEEWFFRLVIFGLLLRAMKPVPAAVFVTLLFAVLHFFIPPEPLMLVPEGHPKLANGGSSDLPGATMNWWTGLWLTGITLANVTDLAWWTLVAAEFGTLLAVGSVLVIARLRTGSLWLGIGLHAGWVTGLKWFAGSTEGTQSLREGDWLPWVGENLKVGLFPLLAVLLTGALALWLGPSLRARSGKEDGA